MIVSMNTMMNGVRPSFNKVAKAKKLEIKDQKMRRKRINEK